MKVKVTIAIYPIVTTYWVVLIAGQVNLIMCKDFLSNKKRLYPELELQNLL